MAMLNNQRVYPTNIPMIFPYKTINQTSIFLVDKTTISRG